MRRAGFAQVAPFDDVMLISYAQDAGNFTHDATTLARVHLNHSITELDTVTGSGRSKMTFASAPLDKVVAFAAGGADVSLRLWAMLKPMLRAHKALALYELLEKPLTPVLADMEEYGVMVDRDDLSAMSVKFERRMGEFEKDIHKLAGQEFNVGSPKQLGEILFEQMKLPGGKKGKAGAWGTDSSVLEELAEQGIEVAQRVMDWRQLAKLKSTYADALIGQIDPVTGRVHTSFQMAVAATGRLSSTDPNLQNIPIRTVEGARIRKAFIAAPGCSLISADYSQIELRLLAHIGDIAQLKKAFTDGLDIHAMTASEMFGVPIEGMPAEPRRRAKAINFGIVYGISAFGLANQLSIDQGEAGAYIKTYFERFPGIRAYMDRTKQAARTQGFVTTIFGRKVNIPAVHSKSQAERAFGDRAAINAPIQGAAADIMRRAMIRMPAALETAGLEAKMLLQVHDELVFEAPEAEADELIKVAKQVMERAAEPAVAITVPLVVEARAATNWDDAH